jgi:hypothetical protein
MILQDVSFNVTHFQLAILLAWVVEGVIDSGGWFRVALDSVNTGMLVCAAAHILCGTVCLSKSIVSVQREFHRKFDDGRQRGAAPSRKIIGQWVCQWRETGSIQVKVRTRRNTVWSPGNIQLVRIVLERSPRRSVWRLRWQQCLDHHGGHLQDVVFKT